MMIYVKNAIFVSFGFFGLSGLEVLRGRGSGRGRAILEVIWEVILGGIMEHTLEVMFEECSVHAHLNIEFPCRRRAIFSNVEICGSYFGRSFWRSLWRSFWRAFSRFI